MAGRPRKKAVGSKKVKPSGPVPCAVLWGLDPSSEKGAAVRAVLKETGVVARTALPERLGDPAGAFARLPGFRLNMPQLLRIVLLRQMSLGFRLMELPFSGLILNGSGMVVTTCDQNSVFCAGEWRFP